MSARTRVFVTGLGMVTAAGNGTEAAWRCLLDGRSALAPLELFSSEGYGDPLSGEARHLPADPDLPRAQQLLRAAWQDLRAASGWGDSERGDRTGIVLGTCQGDIGEAREVHRTFGEDPARQPTDADRAAFANYRPGAGTSVLADWAGARGPCATVGMVCVSSAVAMLHAVDLLRRGECDRAIAGGVEAFSRFVFTGFHCIGALASGPLRPFDARRDGTVLGEGAVLLTLETEAAMEARGATPLAEVLGGGFAADAFHMTAPDPEGGGLRRAVRQALDEAQLRVADVDVVCAHGTGTVFNDAMEANAFGALFDGAPPPIFAAKSVFGHTLGAAGALDAALTVLSLREGKLPPTVGNDEPIEPWDFVSQARDAELAVGLSTNSAFGGNNAAVLLRGVRP